jgi:hypothetical protein
MRKLVTTAPLLSEASGISKSLSIMNHACIATAIANVVAINFQVRRPAMFRSRSRLVLLVGDPDGVTISEDMLMKPSRRSVMAM